MSESPIIKLENNIGIDWKIRHPWFIPFVTILCLVTPWIGGYAYDRVTDTAPNAGIGFDVVLFGYLLIGVSIAYVIWQGHSLRWFELTYYGDTGMEDQLVTLEFDTAVHMPNATQLDTKIGWLKKQQVNKGQAWELRFHDKELPRLLAWLPEHFDKVFKFEGHTGIAVHKLMPILMHNNFARGSFVRTDWTEDPDGIVLPIGVFITNDYDVTRIQNGLEPTMADVMTDDASKKEVRDLAKVRDQYYRHGLTMELELKDKRIDWLEKQNEKLERDVQKRVGAIVRAMKRSHETEAPKTEFATTRKQQIIIIGLITVLVVTGLVIYLSSLPKPHG